MRFDDLDASTAEQMAFVPRAQKQQIIRLVAVFIFVMFVMVLSVWMTSDTVQKDINVFVSAILVAMLGLYTVMTTQRTIDDIMNAEFQNLLFAQAASSGTSFCLFAQRDGTIVYADQGLRKVFRHFSYANASALEGVFAQGNVAAADRERLMSAISNSKQDRLVFPITTANGEVKDFILTVEPLARPGGYSVIRGREYYAARSGTQLMPEALRITSADKLDHLLSYSHIAHFIADPYGRFEYVNPALELMLGYEQGEILANRLSLSQLLVQINGQPVPSDYTLSDTHQLAQVRANHGGVVTVLLDLNLMRDADGKVSAATGSLQPYSQAN